MSSVVAENLLPYGQIFFVALSDGPDVQVSSAAVTCRLEAL